MTVVLPDVSYVFQASNHLNDAAIPASVLILWLTWIWFRVPFKDIVRRFAFYAACGLAAFLLSVVLYNLWLAAWVISGGHRTYVC